MAFTGLGYNITEDVLVIFTFILLILRLVLYHDLHGQLLLPDWFAIAAWVMFLVMAMQDWPLLALGVFEGKIDPSAQAFGPEHGLATKEQTITALKLYYAGSTMYYSQMYFAKASMLAFYHRLFPKSLPKLQVALYVTDVLTFLGWLSSFLIKLLGCQPIHNNWKLGEGNCNTMLTKVADDVRWGPHCLTDLMIYILPLFLLNHLNLSRPQKLGVAATFASGFLCIVFACMNQMTNYIECSEPVSFLFTALEQAWSCIVISMPAMKLLFSRERRKRVRARAPWHISVREVLRTLTGRPPPAVQHDKGIQMDSNGTVMTSDQGEKGVQVWRPAEMTSKGVGTDLESGGGLGQKIYITESSKSEGSKSTEKIA